MEQKLSDKNLLSVLDEATLKAIALNFSKSNFKEIINLIPTSSIDLFANDPLSQQILISILAFSLIKEKKTDIANALFTQYSYDLSSSIFPFLFLKAKLNLLLEKEKERDKAKDKESERPSLSEALMLFNELKTRYEEGKSNAIVGIELESEFEFFGSFFNYLFGIANIELKHKKAVFELKNCLQILGFNEEGFELIKGIYEKYPTDLSVQFEMAKDCVLLGDMREFATVLEAMKASQKDAADKGMTDLNEAYDIHIKYAEMLKVLSKGEYETAKKALSEIVKVESGNMVLLNNICVMNIYENQIGSFIEKIGLIVTASNNPTIKSNMDLLTNLIGIK